MKAKAPKSETRNGLNWTRRFSSIAAALDIPGEAIIDSEVVVVHEGRTNFSELQAELAAGRQDRLVYYAFDPLWRDGDLRKFPQLERKQVLLDLLGENGIELPVLYSEHLVGDGQRMFEHAAKLNWEGSSLTGLTPLTVQSAMRTGSRSRLFTRASFRSSALSRTLVGSRRSILENRRAKAFSIGQGWHRMVTPRLQPDQEPTGHRGQPEVKADATHQEAEIDVG
ncbi:hypothetical protein [Bradyrhizobium sp. CB3481]|uniref:hypothetical protein n=1 Tax=Bradyrhizobium sp. CB3481 TaxID=3039158 RepID=UPI0024B25EBE|nr:hypothetical protein [Bradyrhizobium sp. CB3481]WFU20778.1 hypothetical protein QA643_24735 [Bradyrhizobium sp. CB3481]